MRLSHRYEVLESDPGKRLVLSGISEHHTQVCDMHGNLGIRTKALAAFTAIQFSRFATASVTLMFS